MRRDLEEWLKGKSELLKGLEASGKYAGLPVVRLSTSSDKKTPFKPALEGSLALSDRDVPEAHREASSPSELPSVVPPQGVDTFERVHREEDSPDPSPDFLPPPADLTVSPEVPAEVFSPDSGLESASEEERQPEGDADPGGDALLFPGSEGAEPPLPEKGTEEISSQDVDGGSLVTSEVPEDAPSRGPSSSGPEGSTNASGPDSDRDARLTERLRRVTQMRRAAMEAARRAEAPQRRLRLTILVSIAILVLGTIFAVYRHIRNNSQSAIAQEAQNLYDAAQYEEAMLSFQRGFDRYPEASIFLLGLARSTTRAGHSDRALTSWRLYLDQLPPEDSAGRAQALYEIGRLYALMKNPDKAIEHLMQSSNLDPTHYDARLALGRLLEEENRPAEALNAYRLALELRPSSQEAVDAVKRVAGLLAPPPPPSPEPPDPEREYRKHLEVGTVALNLKRYDDALTHFNQALSIRSDDERPWLGLAGSYQGQGRDAEALKLLQDTQHHIPDSVTIRAKIDELEQVRKKSAPPSPSPMKRRKRVPIKR